MLAVERSQPSVRFEPFVLPISHPCVYVCVCSQLLSCVQLFVTPWTVALQGPLSMGILQVRILVCVAIPSSRGSSPTH